MEDQLKLINSKLDDLSYGFEHKLDLKYALPVPDFDKSLVRGRILKLFQIKEDRFAQALEAVAGEMLYYIVVDNDVAASLLLKNHSFTHQVNLIPNNKIDFNKDKKQETLEYVKRIARDKAHYALE